MKKKILGPEALGWKLLCRLNPGVGCGNAGWGRMPPEMTSSLSDETKAATPIIPMQDSGQVNGVPLVTGRNLTSQN